MFYADIDKYWKIITLKRYKYDENNIAFEILIHIFLFYKYKINAKNYGVKLLQHERD